MATGALQTLPGEQPERSFRSLGAEALLHAYRVNAVGPALVAKHLLPPLPRDGHSVFAAPSARVGSIGDYSAACLLEVIRGQRPEQSGTVLAWNGSPIPP